MDEGAGIVIGTKHEAYLAIFGGNVYGNFRDILGFLKARELDGIVEEAAGGAMPLNYFDYGYHGDKGLRNVLKGYVEEVAGRMEVSYEELIAPSSTWWPTAIRVGIVDLVRSGELTDELRKTYRVQTAIYSPYSCVRVLD